ncbi:sn1-specific diacylglycerol lipase beta-like isoform X2 [Acanthaster planci]|uniref:sn-1-specific diacylglycerol lipase n=1 Tax=Acanthaster planci TaxID=133434 RepID=A0A8B7YMH8_ACAPL|nr:sn1-specific diacylglycerol lipase beta-like isoform X2 [Acanthaster planci]
MPALVLFKRRWRIGSDDFVFPGIWSFGFRIIWLIAVFVVYSSRVSLLDCLGMDLLQTYLIGLITILIITILVEFIIVYVSAQGSILNSTPRRHLPLFLYLRVFVFLVEIVFSIVGAIWTFREWEFDKSRSCDRGVVHLVQAAVITSWLVFIAVIIAVLVLLNPWHHDEEEERRDHEGEHTVDPNIQLQWEQRCKMLCCCAGKDANSQVAYAEVAAILSKFFHGLDIVPSDIVAGLILMQLEQERLMREGEQPRLTRPSGPCLPAPSRPALEEVPLALHYLRFASSAYGWKMFLYSNLCCGTCKLCGHYRNGQTMCCECFRGDHGTESDNCCNCNTAAIKHVTRLDKEDIVYISFHNRIYEIPFFVALDHQTQSVVVTIRGSLSFRDALTDATAESMKLDVEGAEIYAHKGIARTAMYIRDKLEKEHILEKAFERAPDYKLVIAGHSLGAGAGSILAILLCNTWPGLKCYAFAPPGGLLSAEGVIYTADFVVSVLLGEDLVPRLALGTLEELKTSMINIVKRTDRPKYQTLLGGCWWTLCGFPETLPHTSDSGDDHLTEDPESRQPLINSQSAPKPRPNYTGATASGEGSNGGTAAGDQLDVAGNRIELYPPGRILWVTEDSRPSRRSLCYQPSYKIKWATCQDFQHIIVSPAMVADHIPHKLIRALEEMDETCCVGLDSNDHPV